MKRFLKITGIVLGLFLLIVLSPLIGFVTECRPFANDPVPNQSTVAAPIDESTGTVDLAPYERLEEQTYLTLPEWYIVFNAVEYADFTETHRPSQFPYLRAIGQYWRSYYSACRATRDEYAYNDKYHLMLTVIGVSFTAETLVRGIYENSIGRISEWTSRGPTAEDEYAQAVAKEYSAFLFRIPWFEFPFNEKLAQLWSSTDNWGAGLIRKWERKLALSVEYGIKAQYGKFIGSQVEDPYLFLKEEISVWTQGLSRAELEEIGHVTVLETLNADESIVIIPREFFTQAILDLTQQDAHFQRFAGNDVVAITVIAPNEWQLDSSFGAVLYAMPSLSDETKQRVAIELPVAELHLLLEDFEEQNVVLERIYDY